MDGHIRSKLNRLLLNWPRNTAATYPWLENMGIYRQLADSYVRHGWIERIGRGAFKRAGEDVGWQGGVYALQTQLNLSVHPAGKTALQLKGLSHYVPGSMKQNKILLFAAPGEKLPCWFTNHDWEAEIIYKTTKLFADTSRQALASRQTGDFSIKISSAEQAVMELCYLVPLYESFQELEEIMSALSTLRPDVVQKLLEACGSVKVTRLFLYLADKHNHAWYKHLKTNSLNFGKGKRVLAESGSYDDKYRIVVPKSDERLHREE